MEFFVYKFLWLHWEVQWYLADKPPWHGSPVGMDKFEQIRPDLQEEEKQCDHRTQGEHRGKQSDVLEGLNQEKSDLNLNVQINTIRKKTVAAQCA